MKNKKIRKPHYYWTYERCKEEALKYSSRSILKENNASVFYKIHKRKWTKLFKHMIPGCKPRGYWNYNNCASEAIKYNQKNLLKSNSPTVYAKINKNKWYELFEHMEPVGNRYKRMIYSYEFNDNHVYIGLTYNLRKRDNEHLHTEKESAVYKHLHKTGITPLLLKKSDYIDVNMAISLEAEILSKYSKKGWIILNTAKTGSIGNSTFKWDKESIHIEILKYYTITTFKDECSGAYVSMIKNGWRDELCSHMHKTRSDIGYWNNKKLCEIESKKHKTRTELCRNNWSAWNYSKINGWLDIFYTKN